MLRRSLLFSVLAFSWVGCGPDLEGEEPPAMSAQALTALKPTLKKPPFRFDCRTTPWAPVCQLAATRDSSKVDSHLGRGWNEISDQDVPSFYSCLETFSVSDPGLVGPTVTSSFRVVSSSKELKDELNFDGRVSGSAPTQSVPVSGSLEGQVLRLASAHQNAVNVVVRTQITFEPVRISSTPVVKSSALTRFDTLGPRAFRDLCGDRFVEQVTRGAEFIAVLQIYSSDTATQSKLLGRLQFDIGNALSGEEALTKAVDATGAGLNASVNTGGSFTSSFDGKDIEVRIETLQRGGSVLSNVTTVSDLLTRYQDFPAQVTQKAHTVTMGVRLQSYGSLPSFGARQPFSMSGTSNAVNLVLAPAYMRYLDAYNQLAFALANVGRDMYFNFDLNAANALLSDVSDKLLLIESEVDRCSRDSGCTVAGEQALVATNWNQLLSQLPVRKQYYTVTAKDFKAAADLAGALSSGTPEFTLGGQCVIDEDTTPPMPPPGHFRVWTLRGLSGTACNYELFKGGRLHSPWAIHRFDYEMTQNANQTLQKSPSANDLALRFRQVSPVASFQPDTQAIFHRIVLAGPAGNPDSEPWRNAIHVP